MLIHWSHASVHSAIELNSNVENLPMKRFLRKLKTNVLWKHKKTLWDALIIYNSVSSLIEAQDANTLNGCLYCNFLWQVINSLAPGKFEWNFRCLIFQIISMIDGWGISGELALRWMSLNLSDDNSTLVQVMALCCQTPSHYLNQCWPRSLSPYGVTRPQCIKRAWKGASIMDNKKKCCISLWRHFY